MRISTLSASNALVVAMLAAAALANDSPRGKIAEQGTEAAEQLKRVLSQAKQSDKDLPEPKIPVPVPDATKRRASEALNHRFQSGAIDARARRAAAAGEAAVAKERADQARRLRQALGLEPDEERALAKTAPAQVNAWVPVLFASSSMPIPILRSYAVQLERTHGVIAFRGMPGGLQKVGPMAKLSAQILRLDPGCEGPSCAMRNVQLIVDPILFRQHGVSRVPAFAMIPGDPTQPYCEREDDSQRASHLVFGDSALPGLLEEYARLGGAKEVKDAQALLAPR